MCNYIKKDGTQCKLAKTIDLCSIHKNINNISQNAITSFAIAAIMVDDIRKINPKIDGRKIVVCPCGTTTKRWTFTNHCKTQKHRTWSDMMMANEPDQPLLSDDES
jgi:hypothetical protein